MAVWFKGFSAVGNVFGNRCESDWRSRGREFDPGLSPYFRGDWLWTNFYGHSPPFRWIIQEGLLSVTSESMCTKYWLTDCSSLPRKSVARWIDRPVMTIAVDLGRKATTPTNKYPPPHTHTHSKAHLHCTHIGQFCGIIELWWTFPNATDVPTVTLADFCCLLLTFANNLDQDQDLLQAFAANVCWTLYVLMNASFWFDTIYIGWSIV